MHVYSIDLLPGDLITGSTEETIQIPSPGLVVAKAEYDKVLGHVLIWFDNGRLPEAWGPYFGWYIERKDNGKT